MFQVSSKYENRWLKATRA